MNILRSLFGRQPKPAAAASAPAPRPKITKEHSFQVKDGKLGIEADSLDAYQTARGKLHSASEMFNGALEVENLKGSDNSKADFDNRPGHVVLPDEKFESHSDTGKFQGASERLVVNGDDKTVTIETDYIGKATAVWNRENQTLVYSHEEYDYAPNGSYQTKLLSDETFTIAADGTVQLPGASSLAEAETVKPKREMATRAGDLIAAAAQWHQFGLSLDGKAADINPAAGGVVAVEIGRSKAAKGVAGENVMLTTPTFVGEFSDEEAEILSYDLEAKGNQFQVTAGESETFLKGTLGDQSMELTFQNLGLGSEEKLTWNKADGTVRFQQSEKHWHRNAD